MGGLVTQTYCSSVTALGEASCNILLLLQARGLLGKGSMHMMWVLSSSITMLMSLSAAHTRTWLTLPMRGVTDEGQG